MEDKNLLRIAFFIVFVGLGMLLLVYEKVDVSVSPLGLVEDMLTGEHVKVVGEIDSVKPGSGMYILQIRDQNITLPVVVFSKEWVKFNPGDFLEIEGEIEEYKGKKEIIASKIILL